jgi:hypothetical protein
MEMTKELCYFLGLITGRGSFEKKKKIIILEFDYAKPLEGIPYCPKCTEIMKGTSNKKCSNHGIQSPAFKVGPFDQKLWTLKSINDVVLPIISKITKIVPMISQAKTTHGGKTFVSYDFSSEEKIFDDIFSEFDPFTNFDLFEIPSSIIDLKSEFLKEYVSGVSDSAGFPKWANFAPPHLFPEKKDRARAYFQFVRNWKLPVQFCGLLQDKLSIPVDTIRWGHPNIVDGSLKDFDKSGYTAMREHQLKIFAEYFDASYHKFEYKQKIHQELSDYNKSIKFKDKGECVPPKSLKVKAIHPIENHPQIPSHIRNQHFDAYWQICWKMGCNRCQTISTSNSNYVYLTGKNKNFSGNLKDIEKKLQLRRDKKLTKARKSRPAKKSKILLKKTKTISKINEEDTYEPLKKWLNDFLLVENPNENIISEIVATTKLSNLPSVQQIENIVDLVDKLEIRPDVVGFVNDSNMTFIESKIEPLSLSNLGQLLAYCMIADPKMAFLISTEPVSSGLTKTLTTFPELLEYNGKKIRLGQLDMKTGKVDLN